VVEDSVAQITEGINHGFEATTVVRSGKLALDELTELSVEDHGTSLLVANELILQATPKRAGNGGRCGGNLDEIRHGGVVKPRAHGVIHATPVQIGNDGVEEEGLPLIVVWQKIVKDDGDERLDVEDGDCLHVKHGDYQCCEVRKIICRQIKMTHWVPYKFRIKQSRVCQASLSTGWDIISGSSVSFFSSLCHIICFAISLDRNNRFSLGVIGM
jgi:hypothetical protein